MESEKWKGSKSLWRGSKQQVGDWCLSGRSLNITEYLGLKRTS